jgi:glycosyltransferase involved in cell wall biosynthesis
MSRIRVLAIIEAATVTGPAKNLLQFGSLARSADQDSPVDLSIAVFQRAGQSRVFAQAVAEAQLPLYPVPENGRFDRSVLGRLRALSRELQPDLIQSHAVKSHFLVRQAGLHRTAPWIAFHHGYTWPTLTMRLYNQMDRWSLRAAARVVTVSRPFREDLIRRGVPADRIEIVHNAIQSDWGARARQSGTAASLRARLGIPAGRKVVLIVGRLSREKDHRTLLHAVHELRDLDPHLLIVGDGPERARIEAHARDLGMSGAVTLAGQAPTAEPYYALADVAVLSSFSEGSPNALLEAMASRVPIVATKVGGVPEIVADGESALLVRPSDAPAMSGAIRSLLSSRRDAERLSCRACELAVTRHTPAARVRRLVEIYRDTLERGRQAR